MKMIRYSLLCLFFISACSIIKKERGFDFVFKDTIITLPQHPRLLFSKEDEKRIIQLAEQEPLLNDLIDVLHQRAEEMLDLAPQEPDENGRANLGISREQVSRMVTLSLAYRIFDDARYANKVEEELLNVSSFQSWNPRHFLDVAEMTTAVAIGYDWCFDELSPETRNIVEQAILNKAFEPAWEVYEHGDERSWAKRNTNWNVVCNSGLVTGALAIAEAAPVEAARIINYAIEYTPNNIKYFAPNGVYYEGPGYWNYTNNYLVLLLDNLQRNLGSDYGLSDIPGVSQTAKYYVRSLSPSKRTFNFANVGSAQATYAPVYFWFSRRFDLPEVATFYRDYLQEAIDGEIKDHAFNFPRYFFLSIPWFDQASMTEEVEIEKLQVWEGEPDILVFNGKPEDPDRLFLTAKGGKPDMAHNQMDAGSFVVENQGVRWGIDLGTDRYSLPGFFDYSYMRWQYFRNSNLGHNTLNIDGNLAYQYGSGDLIKWDTDHEYPYGIFDISSLYKEQASSVLRKFKMLAPDIMLCKDEVTLTKESKKVNWRFITDANVVNKGTYVELSKNGKHFYLYPFPQGQDEIKMFDANDFISPDERPNPGVTVIEITAEPETDNNVVIAVLMGEEIERLKGFPKDKIISLNEWK